MPTTEIAKQGVEVYKAHPLLTALFALNLVMFFGFGYYIMETNKAAGAYILSLQADIRALSEKCVNGR